MASPPGMRVPHGGSCCAVCIYLDPDDDSLCTNKTYISLSYKGKRKGDDRFIDGKTGEAVTDPWDFCCNVFDCDPC